MHNYFHNVPLYVHNYFVTLLDHKLEIINHYDKIQCQCHDINATSTH